MKIISTDTAPAAIGPYSQAIVHNGMVFCSGQISLTAAGEGPIGDAMLTGMERIREATGEALVHSIRHDEPAHLEQQLAELPELIAAPTKHLACI